PYTTLFRSKRWAEKTEMEMREGRYGITSESKKKTLADAIERYRKYVLPGVKKSRREHILDWWQQKLGHQSLKEINPALITEIRDKLLHAEIDGKKRAVATVIKYLATLSHVLSICVNEWQWLEVNPVLKVSKPSLPKGRTRFLEDDEREKLLKECQASANPYLYTIVILAISVGARRSELLTLTWNDVDLDRQRIVLRETKNGEVRILPLVGLAHRLLLELERKRQICTLLLFQGTDPRKPIDFRSAWKVAVRNANLVNFKFHDLRHTF